MGQVLDASDGGRSDAETMRDAWEARAKSDPLYAIDAQRRSWELGDFYSRGLRLVERIVDPVLKIMSIDPSKLRVLEIGCGMGRLFEGLADRFAEVWGIDISESMIEQGRAQCPVEARWMLGDGISLKGVESESIDHVLSYEVFGHIPQPSIIQSYFNEMHRVLKPGGTFQAQLRGGSDSTRQEIVRRMPRPLRIASAVVLRKIDVLPVRGDIDTWLGCVVLPDRALSMITDIGFVDGTVLAADFTSIVGNASPGYWILGRKPALPKPLDRPGSGSDGISDDRDGLYGVEGDSSKS